MCGHRGGATQHPAAEEDWSVSPRKGGKKRLLETVETGWFDFSEDNGYTAGLEIQFPPAYTDGFSLDSQKGE